MSTIDSLIHRILGAPYFQPMYDDVSRVELAATAALNGDVDCIRELLAEVIEAEPSRVRALDRARELTGAS